MALLQQNCARIIGPAPLPVKVQMSKSIANALSDAARVLSEAEVADARREAAALLTSLLGKDRAFLISHSDEALDDELVKTFEDQVRRRASGEPLQYITGVQEFFGLSFEVSPAALIPRPETEFIVESALECLATRPEAPLLLDVGTGSGCITIALLRERPNARAVAVDVSPAAVALAGRNARRHAVSERVAFLVADAVSALAPRPMFDLIVSNPPYIADEEWETLQREVRDHEPRTALTSGSDGLTMIRRLVAECAVQLHEGGYLIFEIGYRQQAAVERMINGKVWERIAIRPDLQGIPRTVVLKKR